MPLFTMPKKASITEEAKPVNKIVEEEIKKQPEANLKLYQEDYAILGCNKLKFYYIAYLGDRKPIKNITHTYLPDITEAENEILTEMFALKVLIEQLKRENIKRITVFCNFDWSRVECYAHIKDMGSMFRYKANEIVRLMETYPLAICFKRISENEQIKEIVENENKI